MFFRHSFNIILYYNTVFFRPLCLLCSNSSERKETLKMYYGFDCTCEGCSYQTNGKYEFDPTANVSLPKEIFSNYFLRDSTDLRFGMKELTMAKDLQQVIIEALKKQKFYISKDLFQLENILRACTKLLALRKPLDSLIAPSQTM